MKKLFKYLLLLLVSLYPDLACANGLSVFADALYWRASEETASSWASDITTPRPGAITFTPENIDFNWRPGFRTGISYAPQSQFWDTTLYWTYYSTTTSSSISRGSQILLPEFFSGFLSDDLFFGGSVNWRIIMNTVDLEASHSFKLAETLSLRPSIGIKGATINQTITANWDAYIYTSNEYVKHDFSGLGPSFGVAANWNAYEFFNVVGRFSTAYMWGNWNLKDVYTRPRAFFGLVTPTTIDTSMNSAGLGTMMFDYFVGIELVRPKNSRYSLKLGYEMQTWTNQLRLLTFQQLPEHGDLTYQGATCRLLIDL